MKRVRTLALGALSLLAAACAAGPGPQTEATGGPGAVSIEVALRQPLARRDVPPSQVWFVRIGGLNGSPCLPREALFPVDPAPDPTCGRDPQGNPAWTPAFLTADRIEGRRAFLDDPPPARYVVVAAAFPGLKGGTVTLFFPKTLIGRTEMPVPAGTRRFMGGYRLSFGDWRFMDGAQAFVRDRLRSEGAQPAPNPAAGLLGGLVEGDRKTRDRERPARWEQVKAPVPRGTGPGLPW